MTDLRTFYPEIEPYASGWLDVGNGHSIHWERVGTPGARGHRLADVRSTADPAGVTDLSAPLAAPAIANALFTVTGQRFRSLPIMGNG